MPVFKNVTPESSTDNDDTAGLGWVFSAGSAAKNLPTVQETRVRSLGKEDPLGKEMATHSSILAWETHGQRSLVGHSPGGHEESDVT